MIFFSGPGNEYNTEVPGVLNVGMLQELLLTLATLIKRVNLSFPSTYTHFPKPYSAINLKRVYFFDLGNRWLICSGDWVCNETIPRGGLCKGKFLQFVIEY